MRRTQKKAARFSGATYAFLMIESTGDKNIEKPLEALEWELKEMGCPKGSVVKVTFFLKDESQSENKTSILKRFFGENHPASELLCQAPLSGADILLFAWIVCGNGVSVNFPKDSTTFLRHSDFDLLFLGTVHPNNLDADYENRFFNCFTEFENELKSLGLDFSHVVKTWTYFGDLKSQTDGAIIFQSFNRARVHFFDSVVFDKYTLRPGDRGYPANAGIGTAQTVPGLSGIACDARRDTLLVPLENPLQTSAFQYPQARSRTSPLFSRGMIIVRPLDMAILIAGTGSVVGAQTTHLGSSEGQAKEILDILDSLISRENISNEGFMTAHGGLQALSYCVVYLADREAYRCVKAVCEQRLPEGLPVAYVEAGLCRGDQLVEIDSLAFQQREQ